MSLGCLDGNPVCTALTIQITNTIKALLAKTNLNNLVMQMFSMKHNFTSFCVLLQGKTKKRGGILPKNGK